MSEALFEALSQHFRALMEYTIQKEFGRSVEGYAYLLQCTDHDVRELIRKENASE